MHHVIVRHVTDRHLEGNTNGGSFKLFAAIADADSSGIPLAFLFVATSKEAALGAEQAVLECFLRRLKELGMNPEFTQTDKDWSDAMRSIWPNTKYQLCLWHCLRALKRCLCQNKTTPAVYKTSAAHREISFIDPQQPGASISEGRC